MKRDTGGNSLPEVNHVSPQRRILWLESKHARKLARRESDAIALSLVFIERYQILSRSAAFCLC